MRTLHVRFEWDDALLQPPVHADRLALTEDNLVRQQRSPLQSSDVLVTVITNGGNVVLAR